MTPRRKQIIPSFTQEPADDELKGRHGNSLLQLVTLCVTCRQQTTTFVIYCKKPRRNRCAWASVMIACLAGCWSLILIPVYSNHTRSDPDEIVFCVLCSATLRRITRAVPLLSSRDAIIPTHPSASLLHSRHRLDWRHLVCWPRNFQSVRRGTAG
jgi:hypothetical protein